MTIELAYQKIRAYFSKPGAQFGYDMEKRECKFRTPDGRKCAVGCLIPEVKYDSDMEDEDLESLLYDGLGFLLPEDPWKSDEMVLFLRQAQQAHDSRAVGKTHLLQRYPLWELEAEWGEEREIESSIPAFLTDLDEIAQSHGILTHA